MVADRVPMEAAMAKKSTPKKPHAQPAKLGKSGSSLGQAELDQAKGGLACATGTHIKEATLTY